MSSLLENIATRHWKKRVLEHWGLLERLTRDRFRDVDSADEALLYVMEQLEANNWERVRAYQGLASFPTFLTHVVQRLLEDFARQRYGRVRMPAWLAAAGALWQRVFRLLCLERRPLTEVIEMLRDEVPGGRPGSVVREAAATIRARVRDCGALTGPRTVVSLADLDEQEMDHPAGPLSPEAEQTRRERAAALAALGHELLGDGPPGTSGDALIAHLGRRLGLTTEERLLLRMVHQDGMSVSAAGRMLDWDTHQSHGRYRRLMDRIRKTMREMDLDTHLRVLVEADE